MNRHPAVAEIVGHAEHNGLYRLPEGRAAAAAIPVPGRQLTGKRAMLETLARALDFPGWFGFNWDALADCLTDLSWHDGGIALLIDQAGTPETAAPEDWGVLLDILADAARHWRAEGRPFAVFLQGGHAAYPLLA
ncbi:MAG: barstar family protein [Gallionellaceae bacterium]|nr:barstar family protein [Gallionellaceae bacterium]